MVLLLSLLSMSTLAVDKGLSTELVHCRRSLLQASSLWSLWDETAESSSSSPPLQPTRLSRLSGVAGVLSQEPWLRSATELSTVRSCVGLKM